MAPQWEAMTVAWCDGGDSAPELYRFMAKIAALVPHFVRVEGVAPTTRARAEPHTWVQCCLTGFWKPMWDWLNANEVKTVIRGTRKSDPLPWPLPGSEHFGFTFQMPIWDWSDEHLARALDVIAQRGFKPVYPHDCLHCPVERACDRPELRNVAG